MRGKYDKTRADAVLRFCCRPRTLADVRQHFDDAPLRAEWALYNLMRVGKIRRQSGMYISIQQSPGAELARIWGIAA